MKYARQCSHCGEGMNEGYVIGDGEEYYCSEECLQENYTPEEIQEMFAQEDEVGNPIDNPNYWTQWEEEEDFEYDSKYLIN